MILITGGAYQGKLEFAKSICKKTVPVIAEGEKAGFEELEQADIIAHFHLYIRTLMKKNIDEKKNLNEEKNINEENNLKEETEIEEQVKELIQKNPDVIVEITQLGCGVVPMEAFDRSYREKVGRISCMLAKQAEQVWTVNAGIGMRLK